ncbi:MAG: DUF2635 domain-containing protein [Syntrophorhabdus sp.]
MSNKISVIAASGLRCPMEGRSREYITDTIPIEVEDTSYYRRLIADGSLALADKATTGGKTDGK